VGCFNRRRLLGDLVAGGDPATDRAANTGEAERDPMSWLPQSGPPARFPASLALEGIDHDVGQRAGGVM